MKRRFIWCLLAGTATAAALLPASLGCFDTESGFVELPFGFGARRADPFHERLLEIARSYHGFGLPEDEPAWAPLDVAAPLPRSASDSLPSHAKLQKLPPPQYSLITDGETHGRTLFWLFVKETPAGAPIPEQYVVDGQANPVGQVIVMEAWLPEEVPAETRQVPILAKVQFQKGETLLEREVLTIPFAHDTDGRLYHAVQKKDLFIMYKLDPKTPGTDEGWIYGTVTADGQRATSAGLVGSCMKCHQQAPHDRLFGLARE